MSLLLAFQSSGVSGTVLITGGGLVVVSGQEGAARQVVVAGGGLVTLTNFTERLSAPTVTGAGTVTVSGVEGAARQVVVSGNGTQTLGLTTDRFATSQATGGGFVTVTGVAETGAVEGTVAVTGGGVTTASARKDTASTVTVSGNGTVTVVGPQSDVTFAGWREPRRYQIAVKKYHRVRVSGDGRSKVIARKALRSSADPIHGSVTIEAQGYKNGLTLIRVSDSGKVEATGIRKHPAQLSQLHALIVEAA